MKVQIGIYVSEEKDFFINSIKEIIETEELDLSDLSEDNSFVTGEFITENDIEEFLQFYGGEFIDRFYGLDKSTFSEKSMVTCTKIIEYDDCCA